MSRPCCLDHDDPVIREMALTECHEPCLRKRIAQRERDLAVVTQERAALRQRLAAQEKQG